MAAVADKSSTPSLPLASYAQSYVDDWYGEIAISLENNRLVMRFANTPGTTWHLSALSAQYFYCMLGRSHLRSRCLCKL
jgi:hypothetical protein